VFPKSRNLIKGGKTETISKKKKKQKKTWVFFCGGLGSETKVLRVGGGGSGSRKTSCQQLGELKKKNDIPRVSSKVRHAELRGKKGALCLSKKTSAICCQGKKPLNNKFMDRGGRRKNKEGRGGTERKKKGEAKIWESLMEEKQGKGSTRVKD